MKNGAVGHAVEEQQTPDPGCRCLVFSDLGSLKQEPQTKLPVAE